MVRPRTTPGTLAAVLFPLFLSAAACGKGVSSREATEVARFDFEQRGWTPMAERSQELAHSGTWTGVLDLGFTGGTAFSPLIPCRGDGALEISLWLQREELTDEDLTLRVHGYAQREVQHAAIPALPLRVGTLALEHYTGGEAGWKQVTFTVEPGLLHADTRWVRLEWRMLLPTETRGKERSGRLFFDDVVVLQRGSG